MDTSHRHLRLLISFLFSARGHFSFDFSFDFCFGFDFTFAEGGYSSGLSCLSTYEKRMQKPKLPVQQLVILGMIFSTHNLKRSLIKLWLSNMSIRGAQ